MLSFGQRIGVNVGKHELFDILHGLPDFFRLADLALAAACLDGIGNQFPYALAMGKAQHAGTLQRQIHGVDDSTAQSILDIMVDVCNVVSQTDDLTLQRLGRCSLRVTQDTVSHLPGQVQTPAVFLQTIHYAQ